MRTVLISSSYFAVLSTVILSSKLIIVKLIKDALRTSILLKTLIYLNPGGSAPFVRDIYAKDDSLGKCPHERQIHPGSVL